MIKDNGYLQEENCCVLDCVNNNEEKCMCINMPHNPEDGVECDSYVVDD